MELDSNLKETDFYTYCKKCKYKNKKEYEDPCNECLEVGMREGTAVPENFKEKEIY